jgi:S-adenosylmethionine-diacylgycerolhomoserine-N-methlytransferase
MTDAAATARMNRIYRHQRHFYDATRKFYLLGRDGLVDRLQLRPGDSVLEIGCGTGRNLILTAQRYPGVRCCGIDVSTEMLTSAVNSIHDAGLSARVRVAHGDATAFDPRAMFGVAQFDCIFISYSLSMIPQWQAALDRGLKCLAPHGVLHIVDFGSQSGLPNWFRDALRRWLSLFEVTPRDGLEAALAARARGSGTLLSIERPFRDYTIYASLRKTG